MSVPTPLTIQMINVTGHVGRPIEKLEFADLYLDHPGSDLWKPGRLGATMDDFEQPVGSWHFTGMWTTVKISLLLFSNGTFKMSLGKGLPDCHVSTDATYRLVQDILDHYLGVRPDPETFRIGMMSAVRRYVEPGRMIDPWVLGAFCERAGCYLSIARPHKHRSGRINAIRLAIETHRTMHILIDHGGAAQFAGFQCLEKMRHRVAEFDAIMARFLETHPPVRPIRPSRSRAKN